jgi:hypothetical protein
LIEYWDPRLKSAFLSAIRDVRDTSQVEQITQAVNRGDIEDALRSVNLNPANFRVFDKAMLNAFEAGGNATASGLPRGGVPGGLRTIFQFDVRHPPTDSWLRDYTGRLITEITEGQREMVRQTIGRAIETGINPRTAALDLVGRITPSGTREGGLIGLTSSQTDWVEGYASDLRDRPEVVIPHKWNDIMVPGRKLRDRRFDNIVREAIETGEPIPEEKIEKMVASYKNRALTYRAETISRTESMALLHESQQKAMEQAVETGFLDSTNVTFIWRTARDYRVRDSHAAMEGQQVKWGEPFITGAGNSLDYPGDPDGPPEEIINCRCWREPKVDFLAGVS